MSPACVCIPEVVEGSHYFLWIAKYLHKCIYTPIELLSYICGKLGILAFIIGFLPQLYKNHVRQSVDGLSFWLVLSWFLGDVTNFVGALLTNQKDTVIQTGLWFCCMSIITLSQFFYFWLQDHHISFWTFLEYGWTFKKMNDDSDKDSFMNDDNLGIQDDSEIHESDDNTYDEYDNSLDENSSLLPENSNITRNVDSNVLHYKSKSNKKSITVVKAISTICTFACLLVSVSSNNNNNEIEFPQQNIFLNINSYSISSFIPRKVTKNDIKLKEIKSDSKNFIISNSFPLKENITLCEHPKMEIKQLNKLLIGEIFGWTSGLVYIIGRLPQIAENHKNRSTDALSILNFSLCVFGNIMYCLSIALSLPKIDITFFKETFPYLLGSAGTVMLDMVILLQAWMYGSLSFEN